MDQPSWYLHTVFISMLQESLFGTGKYSAHYKKRCVNNKTAMNPVIYDDVLTPKYANAMVVQSLWEVTNQYLIWLNFHFFMG